MLPITTCFVAGLQYLIHPLKLGTIQETINPDALIPVTLLTTEELFGDLEGILDLFDSYDDVFVPEFGSILVEKTGDNSSQVRGNARQVYHMDQVKALDGFSELPSGPYFLYGPNLHQAWRLYDDELGAFTFGIVPDDLGEPDEFQPLTSSSVLGDSVTVPVPSRLYHPKPSPKKPFSGMRVSISDTISVKGTHTAFSSRAWKSLYKEASSNTAKYAQTLLDQGAVIIGKTKTSQFGTGAEWIDQQAPWSARGDGYNSMKGGSVGAAAALVGYPWLDHSIGVDDGRVVSEAGVYSLSRPANLSTDHVITTSKYDKKRLFSRTLKGLSDSTASSNDELLENVSPTKIVVPIDLKSSDKTQGKAVDDFVSILEDHLNVKADRIDVGKVWKQNPPAEASKEAMQTYMSQAPFRSWCYDYYHAFDDFRDEYRKRFHNEPFAEATPQYFWSVWLPGCFALLTLARNQCKTVTEEEHRKDTGRIEIYRRWFDENIIGSSTPNAKSAIVILPCGNPKVEHRNEPVAPPAIYKGIDHTTLAPVLGGSVLSFPFTQVPYKSAISGRTEYRPVCISALSIQGNEKLVIQLIQKALAKKRIPTEVEIGRFTFPVKETDLSSHLQSHLLVQD